MAFEFIDENQHNTHSELQEERVMNGQQNRHEMTGNERQVHSWRYVFYHNGVLPKPTCD